MSQVQAALTIVFPVIFDLFARDGESTIPNHFVQKYDDDVRLVAQQKKSRLEDCVTVKEGIVGSSKSTDRYGQTEANEITDRHGDTNTSEIPHLRRWIDLRDWDHATLLDETDTLKVLEDPTNKYVMGSVAAMNRRKDKIIIAALNGPARKVDSTFASLPAGQIILNGGTNISMAKLRTAIEILNENEADSPEEDGAQRTFVYTAKMLTELMEDSTLTSADFSTMRALQDYKVDYFMGMKWKRVEFLPKTGNIRSGFVFGMSYVQLGIGQNIKNKIAERPDKRHAIQTYTMMSLGAVRVEDEGVVQIDADETA